MLTEGFECSFHIKGECETEAIPIRIFYITTDKYLKKNQKQEFVIP